MIVYWMGISPTSPTSPPNVTPPPTLVPYHLAKIWSGRGWYVSIQKGEMINDDDDDVVVLDPHALVAPRRGNVLLTVN